MYGSLISAEQLFPHVHDPDWLIVDCRFDLADTEKGRKAYRESHIPEAVYAHLDEQLSSPVKPDTGRHPLPDMNLLNRWLASCGMSTTRQVVVYDDSGGAMAARLWWLLKCMGHQKVAVLDGGWPVWQRKGYDTSATTPRIEASRYQAAFNPRSVVTTEQVLSNLTNATFQMIDVRSCERFEGISEPIDPVAGHIPGALNIPLTENLDADGCFKTVHELQQLYAPVCQQWSPQKQVYMCGSGVTACHSVLALAHAGLGFSRVYAGSWSEWIRDPARPMAAANSSDQK